MTAIITQKRTVDLYKGYCKIPKLWDGEFYGLSQFPNTEITALPEPNTISTSNKRLGKLAEDLFSFWIESTPNYLAIFENLQIIYQKQTLGELDVCLLDKTQNRPIHLELITKFFLFNPAFDCNDINAWIGPNRNDSLKQKIEKLSRKQLPLLKKEPTQEYLNKYHLNSEDIIQQVCFKAWLFIPLNCEIKLTQFNQECIGGYYMTLKDFQKLDSYNKRYFCPTKQDWLRFPETQKEWHSFTVVAPQIKLFMQAQQAIMVWVKNKDNFERVIIVPYSEF